MTTTQQEQVTACARWARNRTSTHNPGQEGKRWRRVLEGDTEMIGNDKSAYITQQT